ncbi:MAG TPA: flagellar export chaperone FlgN, partial [Phycisphaerales bacterium]|nr:flagellar export chaperone FlgN [Phycisphaerales bacterium]
PPPPPTPSERLDFSSGGHGEPDVWLPRLQRLISDQLVLAGELDAIDLRKADALAAGNMEGYLGLLEDRQPVIDAITVLNEDLRPFADRFAVLAASLKDEQREAVYAQAGRLDAALAAITQRDTAEAQVLAERRDEVARDLANLNAGRAALGAYGPSGTAAPQSHDERV